jgi:hypothetical protein
VPQNWPLQNRVAPDASLHAVRERGTMLVEKWFSWLRVYGPEKAIFDKSWKIPDIEMVNRCSQAGLSLPTNSASEVRFGSSALVWRYPRKSAYP